MIEQEVTNYRLHVNIKRIEVFNKEAAAIDLIQT